MALLLDRLKKTKFIRSEDILIIGDSFAKQRTAKDDWPQIVLAHLCQNFMLNKVPRGKGFNGASWWASRKLLLSELEKNAPKVLIMTHTEMQRIPTDENYGLNSASVFNMEEYLEISSEPKNDEVVPKEVLIAGQEFYKHLFCRDFFRWAQKQWFHEIDSLVEKYSIPFVIHLHSFEPWDAPMHIFKYGVTFDKPLWDICDDNKLLKAENIKIISQLISTIDGNIFNHDNQHRNHFNAENNIKLADQILDAINNYSHGVRNLQL